MKDTKGRLSKYADHARQAAEDAPLNKAISAIITELVKAAPKVAVIKEDLRFVLDHKGTDGIFHKGGLAETSIGEVITQRKSHRGAEEIIDYIAQETLRVMKEEHKLFSERVKREERTRNLFSENTPTR